MHYDAIILGGGKGGKTLAMDLARAGKRVAMIEQAWIGGSCINVACIPTKTLIASAKVAHTARHADAFGVKARAKPVWAMIRRRKDTVVQEMRSANLRAFTDSGMSFFLGRAHFTGRKTLQVHLHEPFDGAKVIEISGDKVFIDTGARPLIPSIEGIDDFEPLTSESILYIERLPKRLLILGGGYIGIEYAQMMRRLGCRVTLFDRNLQLVHREDPDIGAAIREILESEGIEVVLEVKPKRLFRKGRGVALEVEGKQGLKRYVGSHLLVAVGRRPVTASLNLEATGVAVDERGFIKVNEYLETSARGIWALGDVKGGPQFTHLSLDDYRIVKANLLKARSKPITGREIPFTMFMDPQLARIGLTERMARKEGLDVAVARLPVSAIPRAKALGERKGLMKAVVDVKTKQILGATLLCADAGEVLGTIQTAMMAKLPYTALRDGMFSHPTLVEGLNQLFAGL